MQAWLRWQQARLPVPDDPTTTQQQIVDVIAQESGRNLLFLNAFLKQVQTPSSSLSSASLAPPWTLHQAYKQLSRVKEFGQLERSLRALLDLRRAQFPETGLEDSLQFMLKCVIKDTVADRPDLYDARYFYVTDDEQPSPSAVLDPTVALQRVGHTIGRFVDRAVAAMAREYKRPQLLSNHFWTASIARHVSNPSMLGFLVEQAVLSFLSDDQVLRTMLRGVVDLPADVRPWVQLFDTDKETSAIITDKDLVLYIPKSFNYPAVDAVLLHTQRTGLQVPLTGVKTQPHRAKKAAGKQEASSSAPTAVEVTVSVMPIQITIRDVDVQKRTKSYRFFDRYQSWTQEFGGAKITPVFIFIGGAATMQWEDKQSVTWGDFTFRELSLRLDEVSGDLAQKVRTALASQPVAGRP